MEVFENKSNNIILVMFFPIKILLKKMKILMTRKLFYKIFSCEKNIFEREYLLLVDAYFRTK